MVSPPEQQPALPSGTYSEGTWTDTPINLKPEGSALGHQPQRLRHAGDANSPLTDLASGYPRMRRQSEGPVPAISSFTIATGHFAFGCPPTLKGDDAPRVGIRQKSLTARTGEGLCISIHDKPTTSALRFHPVPFGMSRIVAGRGLPSIFVALGPYCRLGLPPHRAKCPTSNAYI